MKKVVSFLLTTTIIFNAFTQCLEKLIEIPWNTENGLKTAMDFDGIYGLKGFEIVDSNHVAIFSDVEKKIIVFDYNSGKISESFLVDKPVARFAYDKERKRYYFADFSYKTHIYDSEGKYLNNFQINQEILTVYRLIAENGNLYAIFRQKTYQLVKNNHIITLDGQKNFIKNGELINDGIYVKRERINDSIYSFSYFKYLTPINTIKIKVPENTSGLKPLYINDEFVIFLMYTDNNDIKNFKVYKKLVKVDLTNGSILSLFNIPRIEYTFTQNQIEYSLSNIYHILSTPDKAILFKINLKELEKINENECKYPKEFNYEFHYSELVNDNYKD